MWEDGDVTGASEGLLSRGELAAGAASISTCPGEPSPPPPGRPTLPAFWLKDCPALLPLRPDPLLPPGRLLLTSLAIISPPTLLHSWDREALEGLGFILDAVPARPSWKAL